MSAKAKLLSMGFYGTLVLAGCLGTYFVTATVHMFSVLNKQEEYSAELRECNRETINVLNDYLIELDAAEKEHRKPNLDTSRLPPCGEISRKALAEINGMME
jgi:hypothetical protein